MESEQTNLSLEQIFGVLRRRGVWIALSLVVFAGGAYAYSKHQPKKYSATAAVIFSNNPLSQQIAGLSPTNSNSIVAQQDSNLELVRLGNVATKTAATLGNGLTAEEVRSSLTIGTQGETNVIDVQATSKSRTLAASIATTYANEFVVEQQTANSKFFKSALALVNKQLAKFSGVQKFSADALDLQERAHKLSLLEALGYNNAQLAQEAAVPTSPSSPRTSRNTLLGAIAGLLVGITVAFLLERFDRRIRASEDLEAIYGLPLLGTVPKSAAFATSDLPPLEAEAFSLIRAHLRFFNVDREVRTILIASPAPGDGKTTIARHLGEAAARLGARTLLLEVDLRNPTVAQQLGMQGGPGLADVLIGAATMRSAIQSVELRPAPGEGTAGHRLDVLVAGAVLPPNPGELLESRAMGAVLEQAKSEYDLVVIDTPPLTAVSDAFSLLMKVDGVVIVGWVGKSRRDAAERLQRVLAGSGAPVLGIVVNGSKSGAPEPYPGGGRTSPPATSPSDESSPSGELVSGAVKS